MGPIDPIIASTSSITSGGAPSGHEAITSAT
jgi:hypothetical protein